MARPHIQVILTDDQIPASLQAALQRTDATATFWPLEEALRANRSPRADAVIVVLPRDDAAPRGALRILFDRLAEQPRATLVLGGGDQTVAPLAHPPALPVAFCASDDESALCTRLITMLEMRNSLISLHRNLVTSRRNNESIARRYANQLRLASQVQREFLPETLPRFGRIGCNLVFRPVDYVSGDIYHVHRLDEEHVGIAVADAAGHGIPAALLTVYIKRALRGKEIENGSYRILAPDEVLTRLNEDLLDAHLTECPFVATVYGVLNTRTLELSLARGGVPYPIHRTAAGTARMLESAGSVVGVLPDARFEVLHLQLEPGDSLLLYSDGLERVIAPQPTAHEMPQSLRRAASRLTGWRNQQTAQPLALPAGHGTSGAPGAASVATLTCEAMSATNGRNGDGIASGARRSRADAANWITGSAWYALLESEGPAAALEQVSNRQRALRRMGYPLDDLTVLCVQVDL